MTPPRRVVVLWMGIRACPLSALTNNWSVKRRHEFGACVPPTYHKAKESLRGRASAPQGGGAGKAK